MFITCLVIYDFEEILIDYCPVSLAVFVFYRLSFSFDFFRS